MKKIGLVAATTAALALAACGSSTDASEDAVADTVEVPADEAMVTAPDPIDDPDAMSEEEAEAAMAETEATAEEAADAAEAAANDAMDAAQAAEAAQAVAETSNE